jgi:hypothetical protein
MSAASSRKTNPSGLRRLGLTLFPALALATLAACSAFDVGDQSCTEKSLVNDKEDDCPYGPPGGPKPQGGGCPDIPQSEDPATCTTSWDDVFPILSSPTAGCSAGSVCHGESPGQRAIFLPADDANAFYEELASYSGNQGYPYLNTETPTRSWILCNLKGTAGGGSPMPTSGFKLTEAEIATIEAWAMCGLKKSPPPGDGGL